jgi:hypothetical protein
VALPGEYPNRNPHHNNGDRDQTHCWPKIYQPTGGCDYQ